MTARLYVGTYAKYNSGSIAGKWLDLEDYADDDDFIEACKELHKDEHDPELMFQDFEGFPKAFYSECGVSPKIFEWLALDEDDRNRVCAYIEHVGTHYDLDIDHALDVVTSTCADTESDLAYDWCEEVGMFDQFPKDLRFYFDYEGYFKDHGPSFVRYDGGFYLINE